MLIYFKRYVIAVCAIAIALPVIASTLWPLLTGQIMGASLGGLILEFALFAVGFVVGYQIFERRAQRVVDGYLYLYNVDCNPQALISHGGQLASDIPFPCNASGAWFIGYFGQACLDVGDAERARAIEAGLRQSVDAAKKSDQKAEIILYLIPLVEKLGTLDEVRSLIDEARSLVGTDSGPESTQRRTYLDNLLKLVDARRSGSYEELVKLDDSVVRATANPMRLRVEHAWDAASACFKLGDEAGGGSKPPFVGGPGGGFAPGSPAKEGLWGLG